jgi:hypothetical protein
MAMTALEIQAIFRLDDFVTPAFKKIAEEGRLLEKELKRIATDSGLAFGTMFANTATGIKAQIGQVDLLAQAWGRVTAAAALASKAAAPPVGVPGVPHVALPAVPTLPLPPLPPVPGVGRGGHGGGHGGIPGAGFLPQAVPVPGGNVHMRGPQAALIPTAFSLYGLDEAFKMGRTVDIGMRNVFPEGLPADHVAKEEQLKDIILEQSHVTGLPLDTVSKMAMDEIRTNANQPWDARMQILPDVIQNAAREARQKGTDPEGAMTALIGQLHQGGAYSPAEIAKSLPMLAYFASKDPNAVTNIAKSSAHHTPIARTMLGIPIEQDLAAQTVLDLTGVGGKSGTWLREMVLRAAPPLADDMSKRANTRRAQLKDLGLVDDAGKSTWMTLVILMSPSFFTFCLTALRTFRWETALRN